MILQFILAALILALIGALTINFGISITDLLGKKKRAWIATATSFALLFVFALRINDLLRPVLSSGTVSIEYDLRTKEFKSTGELKKENYILKLIPGSDNHYRIYVPYNIKEWLFLYTSYDSMGQHQGRMTWTKDVDYKVHTNYIESNHNLNEAALDGKGRHIFVYTYRGSLIDSLKNPKKVLSALFN